MPQLTQMEVALALGLSGQIMIYGVAKATSLTI